MATGTSLIEVVNHHRNLYDQAHRHLSRAERDKGFKRHWNNISAKIIDDYAGSGNILPQKRSSSTANVGADSPPKRSGHDSHSASVPTAYNVQRQMSGPAGHASKSSQPSMRPTQALNAIGPISIPSNQQSRRASATAASYPQSFTRPSLTNIDEARMYCPEDFLARSPEDYPMSASSLTTSSAVERGEYQPQTTDLTAYNQAFDSPGSTLTPATSETSLTSASTATSEPMVRSNTNDVLCYGVDMMRMNSQSHSRLVESDFAKATNAEQNHLFSLYDTTVYQDFPMSAVDSFSFGSEMKHSSSQDSDTSSPSVISNSYSVSTKAQKLRDLQPKQSYDTAFTKQSQSSKYKIIESTREDGTIVRKAEIPRAARQQLPRKTTFCPHCNDQPQGFHGEHELNRHIDRQHRSMRKVWICQDISTQGFLDGCKACRNNKTYGANYNAAAHLRRAHFNPCKNKRGGRGKKSEGRGGMGGGNKPAMDELKHWMYAMYEVLIDGKVMNMIPAPADGQEDIYAAQVVPADMTYDISMQPEDFEFDYSPPAEHFVPDMAVSMPPAYPMMAPPMQTMQVPAQHYGQVNYMQMQNQPIYIH